MASSGVLEDNVGNYITGVAAAVENLLQQLVEILESDRRDRLVLPAVQLAQFLEHELVGLAFNALQLPILIGDSGEIALLQLLEHGDHGDHGLLQHFYL